MHRHIYSLLLELLRYLIVFDPPAYVLDRQNRTWVTPSPPIAPEESSDFTPRLPIPYPLAAPNLIHGINIHMY